MCCDAGLPAIIVGCWCVSMVVNNPYPCWAHIYQLMSTIIIVCPIVIALAVCVTCHLSPVILVPQYIQTHILQ